MTRQYDLIIPPTAPRREMRRAVSALETRLAYDFDRYPTGMFPAVGKGSITESTSGYRAAWVRDNVHVALAHHECGQSQVAVQCVSAMMDVYSKHLDWFTDVIEKRKSPDNPMNRPHIRFNGETGDVIAEKWPHDQNDALGAFLWLQCRLIADGAMPASPLTMKVLSFMVAYFNAIQFWEDEDSGHWEEQRRLSASSIGVVCAGLREFIALTASQRVSDCSTDNRGLAAHILEKGLCALNRILPAECTQTDPFKQRRYDGALLFLVEPFNIVGETFAAQIISNVFAHLQGPFGIRRYLLDSYWGPDFRTVPAEKRTIDLSEDIIQRDDYAVAGQEAQWCIFDSVISVYFGKRYEQTGKTSFLERQLAYFNRTMMQTVMRPDGALLLPEAYFLENGQYVPNDHLPLQWAQANLWRALHALKNVLSNNVV